MFNNLRHGVSGLFDVFKGQTLPTQFRHPPDRGPDPSAEDPHVTMVAKYPTMRLPLDETMKLFKGQALEDLEAKGISKGHLQRIGYMAELNAQYQHYLGTPVAAEPVEVLAERFANNMLSVAIEAKAAQGKQTA